MLRQLILAFAFAVSAPAAFAKTPAPPPEPDMKPNWGETSTRAITELKSTLFDPDSAQITWTSGFQWGFMKPLIGRRTHGWIACGAVNAKNRMGGYVGAQGFLVFIDTTGTITTAMQSDWISTCDAGPFVPVPPEMTGHSGTLNPNGAVVGVAEELSKLAELRSKGIITDEEFQTQKAKLLGR